MSKTTVFFLGCLVSSIAYGMNPVFTRDSIDLLRSAIDNGDVEFLECMVASGGYNQKSTCFYDATEKTACSGLEYAILHRKIAAVDFYLTNYLFKKEMRISERAEEYARQVLFHDELVNPAVPSENLASFAIFHKIKATAHEQHKRRAAAKEWHKKQMKHSE